MSSSTRMLALLSLLQARRDWPGEVLAERLDVSVRTVRRDVDRLRELGYRVESTKGPEGGYRLDAGHELPPLLLDDEQVVALAIALEAAPLSGVEVEEAAARALATIRRVMPSRLRHRLAAVSGVDVARGAAAGAVDPDVLLAAQAAVRGSEVLRFDHASPGVGTGGGGPPRRVEPHHVVARGGRWYLVGWDLDRDDWRTFRLDRDDWRTFRLDRVSPRVPNGPRFARREVPGGDVLAFLAARSRGSTAGTAWPCTGGAVLALPAQAVAPFVGDGTVEAVAPDRCRVTLGSWSWVALAALLARFDAELADVAPPELADAFGVLAGRAARATAGPAST